MQMEQYENRKKLCRIREKTALPHRGKRLIRKNRKNVPEVFLDFGLCWHLFLFLGFLGMRQTEFFLAFLERRKDYTADPKFHQIPSDSGSIKPVIKV
mgnify:CR=1 FL=1